MSEPFIGEIIMFGGSFAPRGWAKCDGQLIAISQNNALFSILGTTYGGDGRNTFGLPDFRGRLPIHAGNGPGLTPRGLGAKGGTQSETLTQAHLPAHKHTPQGSTDLAAEAGPGAGRTIGDTSLNLYADETPMDQMASGAVGNSTGGNQAHNNIMPVLAVTFIIALVGIFPSRN